MPRPKKAGAPEPKKRSRNGCWPCKARKVKCDELHPACINCQRTGETCDYSIRLNWEGRGKKKDGETSRGDGQITFSTTIIQPMSASDSPQTARAGVTPVAQMSASQADSFASNERHIQQSYGYGRRSPGLESTMIDPLSRGMERSDQRPYTPSEQQFYVQSFERTDELPSEGSHMTYRPVAQRVRYSPSQYDGLPSPSTPDTGSPAIPNFANTSVFLQNAPTSVPPLFVGKYRNEESSSDFGPADRPPKRARYDSLAEARSPRSYQMPPPNGPPGISYTGVGQNFPTWMPTGSPMTPTASSPYSDDASKTQAKLSPFITSDSSEIDARRKPSIESLLSGPAGMGSDYSSTPGRGSVSTTRGSLSDNRGSISTYSDARPSISEVPVQESVMATKSVVPEQLVRYGLDRGFKDLDLGRNDDDDAITGGSPALPRAHLEHVLADEDARVEFGFGLQARDSDFGDDYYSKYVNGRFPRKHKLTFTRPVPIMLSISPENLPSSLYSNPMHLLYFHHFISHTARILVPHHCSSNPFQKLLPEMALKDSNIMSLLLAYSAAHRARLLRQPVPNKRIAIWVQEIVPNLLAALNDPSRIVDNSTLATSIMLASLEIVCPKAFGAEIGWRQHLDIARQMIAMRGGSKSMHQDHSEITHFLLRWFAYLDIMGSLTGGGMSPESGKSWASEYDVDDSEHDSLQIDCLLGFTSRCISILARISDLARQCAPLRIQQVDDEYIVRADYKPTPDVENSANRLLNDAEDSLTHTALRKCPHPQTSGEAVVQWDNVEMAAVNAAYHWAGLIHLYRRVLGKSSEDHEVQNAVQEILNSLHKVREGSTAEACLLFPMFTAGCDAIDSKQKADILKRIRIVEDCGLSQVFKARSLMEKVWETGKPWETLVCGEFVG